MSDNGTGRGGSTGGTKEIITGCPYDCGGSCPLLGYVEDGQLTRLAPVGGTDSLSQPQLRPCARGLSQVQRVYHPDRLRHPMKRTGERGEGKFQRISWDEALDAVAGAMRCIRDRHGPQAILNLRGTGNLDGILHRTGAMADRFFNYFGGCTVCRGIISFEGAVFAARTTFGLVPPAPGPESLLQSRLVIMWGMNPAETIFGTNTNWYLALAKEKGARFVFVDPRFSDSAAALADRWIPILPGTDTAMLIAMATVLIEEKLCDQAYLKRYTCGFEAFRDYCLGVKDGVRKTPAWAEKICGVAAETIAGLAREYAASRPADLRGGWAPGRTAFGEQFHRACIALAAMAGNIGVPGGGPGCWINQNFLQTLGVANLPVQEKPARVCAIASWRWADAVIKGTAGGYPSDIKMIYSIGGDRLNQGGDINKGVKALKQVEFVVTQDQFLTPLGRFADIVLPVNTHFERDDVQTPHHRGYYLIYNHKVIQSLYESKSDLEILTGLADRLGMAGFNDRSEGEWLEKLMSKAPVGAETLSRQGVYRFASFPGQVPFQEFIADPDKNPLPTPSGKIELFSEMLAARGQAHLPPVPQYVEEWEGPGHPTAGEYPLLMVTTHTRKGVNSTFDNISWLRELEPHALWINPGDAGERNISEGDRVKVYNGLGALVIRARITARVAPGVVAMNQGAWYQPGENGVERGGSVNVLCRDTISPGEAAATNGIVVQVARQEE
ncbi:MAG: molybdopterin-dependent oxidoreductase [Chloroflexi bacterium]|nr:molybdopterin-dependent oxidoreductase [Chloroflexota bacterium]